MESNNPSFLDAAIIEGIAKTCHQANKAFCESMGDNSFTDWEDSEDWVKALTIFQVRNIIANPLEPHYGSHDAYVDKVPEITWENAPEGFNKKLSRYEEWSIEDKTKSKMFKAIVEAILHYTDYNKERKLTAGEIATGARTSATNIDVIDNVMSCVSLAQKHMNEYKNPTSQIKGVNTLLESVNKSLEASKKRTLDAIELSK